MISKLNKSMQSYQKKAVSQGATFNRAGEMTSKPTPSQVSSFNKQFSTTTPSVQKSKAYKTSQPIQKYVSKSKPLPKTLQSKQQQPKKVFVPYKTGKQVSRPR